MSQGLRVVELVNVQTRFTRLKPHSLYRNALGLLLFFNQKQVNGASRLKTLPKYFRSDCFICGPKCLCTIDSLQNRTVFNLFLPPLLSH